MREQQAYSDVLDDPELAAAVERVTGADLSGAGFGKRVTAVQKALAGPAAAA